jgi:hypothetical protein
MCFEALSLETLWTKVVSFLSTDENVLFEDIAPSLLTNVCLVCSTVESKWIVAR